MKSTQQSYQGFLKFMDVEIRNIESIKLPKKRDLQKLSNLNVAATFGSAGSLLSSLASGALDAAGFVGDFFSGKKRGGGKPNPKAGGAIPKGKGIKLGGIKALGIANAVFAGLDFATGLSEGESVGKAAAGAGGALAGSLLGGAIGSVLIPAPPIGFILGSMAGNFLGGYLGDRAHEAVTGTGKQDLKSKQKEKLKVQEAKQKAAAMSSGLTMSSVLDKFDSVVTKFEQASIGTLGSTESSSDVESKEMYGEVLENDDYGDRDTSGSNLEGTIQDLEASGGSLPSSKLGSKYGMRFHPILGRNKMHMGNDYPASTGTPVSVIQPGVVANAGFRDNGYGVQVKVDHPGGVSSFYAHLNSTNVKAGQQITPGTVIGEVGSTGQSTGPHLHFEVDVNGKTSDPNPYQDKIFRFGGNVKVKSSAKPQQNLAGQDVQTQQQNQQNKPQASATGQNPSAGTPRAQQDLSKMSTDQLKSQLDPTVTAASNPSVFAASQEARTKGQESGLTGEDLERAVMIASIQAKNVTPQVTPIQTQVPIQQLQQYPTYNQQQSTTTIVPMMMSSGGGGQQRPQVISVPGAPGQTIVLPGPSTGQLVNSLFKTMLLTNLSAS
jgi:murein DD-endopeptidase MepM/ murein hydrolase activator NlpD